MESRNGSGSMAGWADDTRIPRQVAVSRASQIDRRREDTVRTAVRRRPRHAVLIVGLLAWVLWEQSGARPWKPHESFEERGECVRALMTRVGLLEAQSKRTTAPLVSEVHEVAASLGTLDDPRASVFLVCLPTGIDLRAQ
jgi:hypothetical protein